MTRVADDHSGPVASNRAPPPTLLPITTANGGRLGSTADHDRRLLGLSFQLDALVRPVLPGAPGRIRTCDARFRKPTLYPLSYGSGLGKPTADDPSADLRPT